MHGTSNGHFALLQLQGSAGAATVITGGIGVILHLDHRKVGREIIIWTAHQDGNVAAVAEAGGDGVVLIRRRLNRHRPLCGVVRQPRPAAAKDSKISVMISHPYTWLLIQQYVI